MKLHNTLSRQTEEFRPIDQGQVRLYTCGPTVYDYAHIGNLRSFVFDDLLRRTLAANYEVKHVMNITDVGHLSGDQDDGEDKLERGAAREQKTVWEVADFYIDAFQKDASALNILPPNGYHGEHSLYARATDFIDQQIEMIKILLEKDFAYQREEAIYFDVMKLSDYGKLTGQKLSEKETAARPDVVTDYQKKHPQDFALWFFKTGRFTNHSMSWPSPWGEGFPGWHLECSAIIHATLGEPIDIHTGGVDHIGTHHTNEIAQTEAAFGVNLANYWLHNEHLMVDGQRMAKSSNNFYTLKDIADRGIKPLALRLLYLQSHYRSRMNFTWESLEAAQSNLNSLYAWADQKFQANQPLAAEEIKTFKNKFEAALGDDLNSSEALAALNQLVDKGAPNAELLEYLDERLGLDVAAREDITAQQKALIKERQEAREAKDWPKSDELRDRLKEQGIELNDGPSGVLWSRS